MANRDILQSDRRLPVERHSPADRNGEWHPDAAALMRADFGFIDT